MSKPSFKVVLKDKTVAIVESAGGVCFNCQFDNMLAFNDKESGEVIAMFPASAIASVGKSGAVSKEGAKGIEEMGQDSNTCHQEDTAGKRTYRALYHAQKKKSDDLSREVEGLYKQICALNEKLTSQDCEIRALKSNDHSWVGVIPGRRTPSTIPYYSLQDGDSVLPIRFKVIS